jgi:uncharacterized RDD family membrane protein YckC
MAWYYLDEKQQQAGPVGEEAFSALAKEGHLTAHTLVWREGWPAWRPYGEIAVAFSSLPQVPPPAPSSRRYAGFWIRVAAKVIDGIILGVGGSLVIQGGFAGVGALLSHDASVQGAFAIFGCLLNLTVQCTYAIYFVGRYGATPGKMACGLRIVRADGQPMTYGVAAGRLFAEALSALTLGIGYLMVACDGEKRALHDRVCGTRVVYKDGSPG